MPTNGLGFMLKPKAAILLGLAVLALSRPGLGQQISLRAASTGSDRTCTNGKPRPPQSHRRKCPAIDSGTVRTAFCLRPVLPSAQPTSLLPETIYAEVARTQSRYAPVLRQHNRLGCELRRRDGRCGSVSVISSTRPDTTNSNAWSPC